MAKKSHRKSIFRLFGWIIAVMVAFCIMIIPAMEVEFSAELRDMRLYKLSVALFLLSIEFGLLFELDFLNLKNKITFIKTSNFMQHILFWFFIFIIGGVLFWIPFSFTSTSFKENLAIQNTEEQGSIENSINDCDNTSKNNLPLDIIEDKESEYTDVTTHENDFSNDKSDYNTDIKSWMELSNNRERYKKVMSLLGENFYEKSYSTQIDKNLKDNEKDLVKRLFVYYLNYNELPEDFTSTFTAFCVGEEFEDMIIELDSNSFYRSLSKSFKISYKSDGTYYIDVKEPDEENGNNSGLVTEDNPLTFVFEDNEDNINIVGKCSFKIKKVELIYQPFKSYGQSSTYAKYIRIYGTVKNESAQETYFSTKKPGGYIIGQYYGMNDTVDIGWNNNYKWKVSEEIKTDCGYNLAPYQTKDFCVSGVFISEDVLKYTDKPIIELYFTNEDEVLTLKIN